ncbi:MAG: aquaporin, partial [Dokdonella sp.]
VSGAHFNPAVTLMMVLRGHLSARDGVGYVLLQIAGALIGVAAAHAMFDLPVFTLSQHTREGASQVFSEFVATFGLVLVIIGSARFDPRSTPGSVAAYITAAYWFTASTSFANPAVSIARALTDTFSGIALTGVPWFIAAELAGAIIAVLAAKILFPEHPATQE